jgi:hypothetical protein
MDRSKPFAILVYLLPYISKGYAMLDLGVSVKIAREVSLLRGRVKRLNIC